MRSCAPLSASKLFNSPVATNAAGYLCGGGLAGLHSTESRSPYRPGWDAYETLWKLLGRVDKLSRVDPIGGHIGYLWVIVKRLAACAKERVFGER